MTAPDHDAARWGATPPGYEATNTAGPAPSLLPASPAAGSNDLRDRIAEALIDDFRQRHGEPDQIVRDAKHRTAALAMAVVQPVLDAKDAEIARLRAEVNDQIDEINHLTERYVAAGLGIAAARQRAEQAEELLRIAHDTSNTSEAERARAVQRAEAAERELATLRHQQIGDL